MSTDRRPRGSGSSDPHEPHRPYDERYGDRRAPRGRDHGGAYPPRQPGYYGGVPGGYGRGQDDDRGHYGAAGGGQPGSPRAPYGRYDEPYPGGHRAPDYGADPRRFAHDDDRTQALPPVPPHRRAAGPGRASSQAWRDFDRANGPSHTAASRYAAARGVDSPPLGPRIPRHPDSGRPPRRPTPGYVIIGRILSTMLALALLGVSGIAWSAVGGTPHNASNATNQAGSVGVSTSMTTTTDAKGNVITVPVATHGTNILVVGSDARMDADGNPLSDEELRAVSTGWDGGGVSTDTLMIVHVPGNGAKATAISIPRDSWIDDTITQASGIVGPYEDGTEGPYKANKINSFYGTAMTYEREYLVSQGVTDQAELFKRSSEAGRTMLIKVIQQFTGIKIDHYAEINLIGFYLLSDAIGGVPVCLLEPVKDRQSGADFPAGQFEVTGSQALSFVRQRHGLPNGDLDRIRRQQAFLASAANQILSASTLTNPRKLSDLVTAANRSLVLDNGFDLLSFAQQMMNLTSGNITFTTIPTHGNEMVNGKSALDTNPDEVRAFFANLMTDPVSSSSAPAATSVARGQWIVDVQNGTETPGMAAQSGAVVAAAGFQRGQMSDYPGVTPDNQQSTTTIHYPAGGETAAADVAAVLKVGTPVEDDTIESGRILVVVGTDMPPLPPDQIPSVPASSPATSAPASGSDSTLETTLPSDAINAAHVACIN